MWFAYDWLFEFGFCKANLFSVQIPGSPILGYFEPETDVRLHSCGPFSFPVCISKQIPGCHEAFAKKQSYL